MRVAIPVSDGRISPVFDAAGHLLLVDIEGGPKRCKKAVAEFAEIQQCATQMRKWILAPSNSRVVRFGKLAAALTSSGDSLNSCEFSYRIYELEGQPQEK